MRNYVKGSIFMVFALSSWLMSILSINLALGGDVSKADSYYKPFMITYIESSSLSLCLLPSLFYFFRNKEKREEEKRIFKESLKYAIKLLPFMQGANIVNEYTYLLTSISSSVIINESTMIFVFFISLFLWEHTFTWNKLLTIVVAIEGVIIITLSDSEKQQSDQEESLLGDLVSIFDSFLYGCYGVLIYYLIPPEKEKEVRIFTILGCIGLLMLSFFWIFVLGAHFTGIEPIEAPDYEVLIYLFFDVLFGMFGYEYFYFLASIYLGPVTANVSTAAIIPFSMMLDAFWKHTKFSPFYYVATIAIFQSVIC